MCSKILLRCQNRFQILKCWQQCRIHFTLSMIHEEAFINRFYRRGGVRIQGVRKIARDFTPLLQKLVGKKDVSL